MMTTLSSVRTCRCSSASSAPTCRVGVTSVAEGVADLFSLRAVLGKHTTGSSSLHMGDGMDHVSSAVLTGCFFVLPDKRLPLLVVHIV